MTKDSNEPIWTLLGDLFRAHPWHGISIGDDAPEVVNAYIEIVPSDTVKYELDKESGAVFVDRFLHTSMRYPCNYGFIPHTLSADGDPTDVMVVMPVPINYGAVVTCRPVGVLHMEDEAGEDAKVLAVPTEDVTGLYRNVKNVEDVDELLRLQIHHFFDHYKDLETGKWVKIQGWGNAAAAQREIMDSVDRYNALPEKPENW